MTRDEELAAANRRRSIDERFRSAKRRALKMLEMSTLTETRPIEALCTMIWALHLLRGLNFEPIYESIGTIDRHAGLDGLRRWIEELP